jgi:hypothetical protein
VFLLSSERALVSTVDFFTPIVDDPSAWGAIAAANALSDIYAMGATPLFGLNLVGWPREQLPFEILGKVLGGAAQVARQAKCLVLGGHSIDSVEPMFGMAVVGEVHPDRMLTNAGACAGDRLVLTKPLGTGILATALKRDALLETGMTEAREVDAAMEGFDLQVQYALMPQNRQAIHDRIADFHPYSMLMQHKAIDAGRPEAQPIDKLLITVSPPNERGFVCVGKGATLDLSHEIVAQIGVRPERGKGLPYLYAMSTQHPPHQYFRLPSVEEVMVDEGRDTLADMITWNEKAKRLGWRVLPGDPGPPPQFLKEVRKLTKPYGVKSGFHYSVHAGQASPDAGFAL